MEEREPTTEINMALRIRNTDLPSLIGFLANKSVGEVQIGQGELAFIEEMEREGLKQIVTVHAARRFYDEAYHDDRPSHKATQMMNRVGLEAPASEKVVDDRNRLISVSRSFWDGEMLRIRRGESKISWKPGSKMRDLAERFDAFLPPVDEPVPKKKKSK